MAADSQEAFAYHGKADAYVPTFNNQQRDYREFRKRCELYRKKMELAGRSAETIFNIVTLLNGRAWDMMEDIGLTDLEAANAYNMVFERLDRGFKYDAMTELPDDFETFFIKLHRRNGQTLRTTKASSPKWNGSWMQRIPSSFLRRCEPGGSCAEAVSAENSDS